MASIIEITNPLTGAVEQVDKLDHTAQEVDDGIAKAFILSNPNLLDNPFFQVAQAGYGALHGSIPFAADRWRINVLDALTCEGIAGGGIKLTSRGLFPYVEQFFDTDRIEYLKGKTVTFGCNVLSLVRASDAPAQLFFSSNGAIIQTIDFLTAGIHSFTFEVPSDSYSFTVGLYVNAAHRTAGTVMELNCLKLELGSVCTIANDVAPDYGEQLARCHMYYYRMRADNVYSAFGTGTYWSGNCMFVIPFPTTMRTIPVFSYSGRFVLVGGPSVIAVSSIASDGQNRENSKSCACITAHPEASISVAPYILQANNDTSAYLEWTADL